MPGSLRRGMAWSWGFIFFIFYIKGFDVKIKKRCQQLTIGGLQENQGMIILYLKL
jgi:hypothetical protein